MRRVGNGGREHKVHLKVRVELHAEHDRATGRFEDQGQCHASALAQLQDGLGLLQREGHLHLILFQSILEIEAAQSIHGRARDCEIARVRECVGQAPRTSSKSEASIETSVRSTLLGVRSSM